MIAVSLETRNEFMLLAVQRQRFDSTPNGQTSSMKLIATATADPATPANIAISKHASRQPQSTFASIVSLSLLYRLDWMARRSRVRS
jgi:hypothetical protein